MTAPRCNPATLRGLCAGGCGRQLHRSNSGGDTRPCTEGHPGHSGRNLCPGCYSRDRRNNPTKPGSIDLTWQQDAACRGAWPELFFPDIRAGQNVTPQVKPVAERYCAACPVRTACDRYAEATHSLGLWAGVWRRYHGTSYTRTRILQTAA